MNEETQCPFKFFPKQASLSCIYDNPIMVITSTIDWRKRLLPFVHSYWWHFDKPISSPAPSLPLPLPLPFPLSLSLSPSPLRTHTCAHTHPRSHYRCHGGDGGHLIVFCPGLEVLQSVQGGVVQAERVGLQRLAQRLLESFLLKLQHQPVGLLPLSLSLLRSLPPEGDTEHRRATFNI